MDFIFAGKMIHTAVFPPVLESDEAFVADGQSGRSAALTMLGLKGLVQDVVHGIKGFFLHTKELLEHRIAELQGFNDSI